MFLCTTEDELFATYFRQGDGRDDNLHIRDRISKRVVS